ncbi:hypothetical protein GF366_03835, partial [Candidatus Peregrinibacteria bacterium]|nr:hypothetical protein [Candidatus Peregrinibacteria bacterium]
MPKTISKTLDSPDIRGNRETEGVDSVPDRVPNRVSNISRVICAAVLSAVFHVGICSKVADYMSSPSTDAVVLVDGKSFNKDKFIELVKQKLEKSNKFSESLSGKEFFFSAELFELIDILGEKEAMKRYRIAVNRYQNLIKRLLEMKNEGVSHEEIYNYLIQFQGVYAEDSSFVTNLLYNGSGNCEARAKLMTMALEEVFKGEIEVNVEITNIKNLENGNIIPHISIIVEDGEKNYYLELPGIKKISKGQLNELTVFNPVIFNRAYLAEGGKKQYSDE